MGIWLPPDEWRRGMKLSIRMKIFLPVMLLLIAFPVAAWFVFSYALDGHMI